MYVGVDRILPKRSIIVFIFFNKAWVLSTKSTILQEFKVVLDTRRYLCR